MNVFLKSLHPKVVAATLGSLLASAIVGILGYVQTNPDTLAGLPPWATAITVILIPPLLAFAAGYTKAGPGPVVVAVAAKPAPGWDTFPVAPPVVVEPPVPTPAVEPSTTPPVAPPAP